MDLELKFVLWINGFWKFTLFDYIFPWLTYLGSHIAVILFILLSWILTKNRRILFSLVTIYFIQSFLIYGLKYLIQRERPLFFLQSLPKIYVTKAEVFDPSFPSAHATYAFMMATILSYWFPRYRLKFFIVALIICWTRVYLYLHFPTDVIAGAFFGYILTKIMIRIKKGALRHGASFSSEKLL